MKQKYINIIMYILQPLKDADLSIVCNKNTDYDLTFQIHKDDNRDKHFKFDNENISDINRLFDYVLSIGLSIHHILIYPDGRFTKEFINTKEIRYSGEFLYSLVISIKE